METKIKSIISYLFIILLFISPIIFSPFQTFSFSFAKMIPLFIAVFGGIFLWILHVFNQGRITFPKNSFFYVAALVPLSYLISSFFSVYRHGSFIGTGQELGTASTIGLLFLLMFLVSVFLRTKDKIFLAYSAFASSYLLLAVFHILRLFLGVKFLNFNLFINPISTTLDRWTDLSLFSGIALLLSLMTIEFFRFGKSIRIISYVVLATSLFMVAVTNFPIFVWGSEPGSSLSLFGLIGIFSLVFFVYLISSSYDFLPKNKEEDSMAVSPKTRTIPYASLVTLVISIIFTLGATPLQNFFAAHFNTGPATETRLLWQPTFALGGQTFKAHRYFGAGPEQFNYEWRLNKPQDINNSIVWNSNLDGGIGFIPSSFVTVGIVGFLAWLAFLIFFVRLGYRALFSKIKDPMSHYLTVSSFLISVYLWISLVVYSPSITLFILTFIFTGLFLGSLYREEILVEKTFVFEESKRKSFVTIMSLIVVLLLVLFWAYSLGEKVAASMNINKANATLSQAKSMEDVAKSRDYIIKAYTLDKQDGYLRALANVSLAEVNSYLQDNATSVEIRRPKFEAAFQRALGFANAAISLNKNNYDNYITLGNVLETVIPLNVPQAYENAKLAYAEAQKLNPKSPLIPLLLARVEVEHKNLDGAKQKIAEALTLKPYYLDAIVLLARIQIGQGENEKALQTLTVAQSLDPQNADINAVIEELKKSTGQNPNISNVPEISNQTATSTSTTKTATSTKNK